MKNLLIGYTLAFLSLFSPILSAGVMQCRDQHGKLMYTDDKNKCVGETKQLKQYEMEDEIAAAHPASDVIPADYFTPHFSDIYLGQTFSQLKLRYGDRLNKLPNSSYTKNIDTVSCYKLYGDDVKANFMYIYVYDNIVYRLDAKFHQYTFEAVGGSDGLLARLKKLLGEPNLVGNEVKQSVMYGQWVPWVHEAYRWDFNNEFSSVLLMSSNKNERGSIQMQLNHYEAKVEEDVKKQQVEKVKF